MERVEAFVVVGGEGEASTHKSKVEFCLFCRRNSTCRRSIWRYSAYSAYCAVSVSISCPDSGQEYFYPYQFSPPHSKLDGLLPRVSEYE